MEMNFNIYGFAAPRSKAEYAALLDEALRIADELSDQITRMEQELAETHAPA
jgi:hypothetical protein